ncbi:DUF1176 domain-containing protein [Erwinia endophytica]|uniref:DUF1176 domain-containing protein n=1 Tax=Erwinia endophytica TaxID=1563158 RepID=UPI001265F7E5|nr:DUF1176 domain-containing protein [Erwinia endophytica]KAB8309568.1 DUF1176 domain-containing protein [Erwinia endophytica]
MRYWMKYPFALLSFTASLHAEPLQKIFSDWQISCNNQNYCVARNIPGNNGLVMTVSRHAGSDDRPSLRLDYGNAYTGELSGAALEDNLLLDGQQLKLELQHWDVQPHHLMTIDTHSIDAFFAQVMDANHIQLQYRPTATISLQGLKAALSLMDDIQGRVNNMSAWIKRGDRIASEVPPEPSVPDVIPSSSPTPTLALTHDEMAGLTDFGIWRVNTNECPLEPARRKVTVWPLSDEKALLLVNCEMGAYNVIDLAFEVTRTQPYVAKGITLKLPFVPPGRGKKQIELINANYDPDKEVLRTFSKGRGLGDCGVTTRWQYHEHKFELVEYAQEQTCDAWHGRDDWPTLWVSNTTAQWSSGNGEMSP